MGARRPSLSETELEVLRALWQHGPGTVRDVDALLRERGRRWAYTTVLTLLHRLLAKGYVASDKTELAHVFRATVSRDKLIRQRLSDLADQLCEGTATPLVHALVQGHRFSAEETKQLRQLINDLAERQGKEKPRGGKGR